MKYYRVEFIEGHDGEGSMDLEPVVQNECLAWAEIDGNTLVYATTDDAPPNEREIKRRPRFFDTGFCVEVEEAGRVAMLKFTEYHGKRRNWSKDDHTTMFKRR